MRNIDYFYIFNFRVSTLYGMPKCMEIMVRILFFRKAESVNSKVCFGKIIEYSAFGMENELDLVIEFSKTV